MYILKIKRKLIFGSEIKINHHNLTIYYVYVSESIMFKFFSYFKKVVINKYLLK